MFFGTSDHRNVLQVGIPGAQRNNRAHLTSLLAAFKVCTVSVVFCPLYIIISRMWASQICSRISKKVCIKCCSKISVRGHSLPPYYALPVWKSKHSRTQQVDGVCNINKLQLAGWRKTNGKPLANLDLWKQLAFWRDMCPDVTVEHMSVKFMQYHTSMSHRNKLRDLLRTRCMAGWHTTRHVIIFGLLRQIFNH